MSEKLTIECRVHFHFDGRGSRKHVTLGEPPSQPEVEPGRVPRISRLMALAIRFDQLIRDGEITNYAELARLGHVTRARITQIMNLLNLAPDVQEEILFLPRVLEGKDPLCLRQVLPVAALMSWREQRGGWKKLCELTRLQ